MLLISRFRTLILLLCLLVPRPGLTQKCWEASDTLYGPPYDEEHKISTPGNLCIIDPGTGLGFGDEPKAKCPPGNYSKGNILCGPVPPDNDTMCCCENDPPNQSPACNNLYNRTSTAEKLCVNDPIFKNSSWCKPKNVCQNSNGQVETCDEKAPLMPYCAMDAQTGQPLGCPWSSGTDCPLTSKFNNIQYVGSDMLCGKDEGGNNIVCCCVGNPTEPCNGLTKLCQLDQYKNMTACQPTTTTSSTPSSNPNPNTERHQNGIGFKQPNCIVGGLLLITGILSAVDLHY